LIHAAPTSSADFAKLRAFTRGDGSFDGDNGLAMRLRAWDHRLRQVALPAAPYEVVVDAPIEDFSTAPTDSIHSATTSRSRPFRLNK
jgi:hypothetical protein